jgi:hypothetical protein
LMWRTQTVTSPDGVAWQLSIRWRPRWRALARRFGGWRDKRQGRRDVLDAADWVPDPTNFLDADCGHGGGGGGWFDFDFADDLIGAVVAVVTLVAAGLLFWWLVLPALLLLLDVIIVAALTVVGVLARGVLHRPWTIQATAQDGRRFTKQVVGWRNAQTAIADDARRIRTGTSPVLESTAATQPAAL